MDSATTLATGRAAIVEADSNEALMLAYGRGEAAAFDVLYARHRGGVYRYLARHSGNAAIGEEIFQEVWMKVIRARERYTVKAKFTTWLYHIAHNCLIDHYRRQKGGHDGFATDVDEDGMDALPDNAVTDPGRLIASRQALAVLRELIEALPAPQREAFLLHEEGGLTVAEIAEVSGIKPEAAKSRLRYAVAKLRTGLADNGVEME